MNKGRIRRWVEPEEDMNEEKDEEEAEVHKATAVEESNMPASIIGLVREAIAGEDEYFLKLTDFVTFE